MEKEIRAIEIRDKKDGRIVTLFPDQKKQYWDGSVREKAGVYWYYQLHFTAIVDMLYKAGRLGREITIKYIGGDEVVV